MFKIHITTDEGELLHTLEINENEMNWNTTPTKHLTADEIFNEIEKAILRSQK